MTDAGQGKETCREPRHRRGTHSSGVRLLGLAVGVGAFYLVSRGRPVLAALLGGREPLRVGGGGAASHRGMVDTPPGFV